MNDLETYRVYDAKGRYHQSYSKELPDGFLWAKMCAIHIGGAVKEQRGEEEVEVFSRLLL